MTVLLFGNEIASTDIWPNQKTRKKYHIAFFGNGPSLFLYFSTFLPSKQYVIPSQELHWRTPKRIFRPTQGTFPLAGRYDKWGSIGQTRNAPVIKPEGSMTLSPTTCHMRIIAPTYCTVYISVRLFLVGFALFLDHGSINAVVWYYRVREMQLYIQCYW